MIIKQKELAIILSSLKHILGVADMEQYQTPGEIAADALWIAHMQGDIEGKKVADLGCGNGILGCGALLLGAKHVVFLDADRKTLLLAKENVHLVEEQLKRNFSYSFLTKDVAEFSGGVDCVVQNPPFGVQQEHADRKFLFSAVQAKVAYSFHKLETRAFVEEFVKNHHKAAVLVKAYSFPLKWSKEFHTRPVYSIDVGLWRIS